MLKAKNNDNAMLSGGKYMDHISKYHGKLLKMRHCHAQDLRTRENGGFF